MLEHFAWILAVFGVLLIVTGVRLAVKEEEVHPEKNLLMRLARRLFPVAEQEHGNKFLRERMGGGA